MFEFGGRPTTERAVGAPHGRAVGELQQLDPAAVAHGRLPGRDFRLALLDRRTTLRIEVTDTRGDDLPRHHPPAAPDAESGRGLLLVEAFADRWGVLAGPVPRKTVWAELDLSKP
ncbi:ATP-binding protein [Streptomyces massasporeus]